MGNLIFNPPIIAHRGASAYAPENTMFSFMRAVQQGARWLEFDVMLTADDMPVIFHDERLDRTSSGRGYLHHQPYAKLASLDAGGWFDSRYSSLRIPMLDEVRDFLSNHFLSANVELKPLPGQEEKLAQIALACMHPVVREAPQTLLFSSFSVDALYALRKHSSTCQIGLLLDEWRDDWQMIAEELEIVSVHVNHELLTPELAVEVKQANKKLLCYTVNQPELALMLYDWGVDAVFTDMPDKILAALKVAK